MVLQLPENILIVYGSLAPDKENHHIISHIAGSWTKGKIFGKLEDRGWGAGLGYPGFTLAPGGEWIEVEIFISADLPNYWKEIDEFEGEEYARQIIDFEHTDGSKGKGSIYLLRET